MRGVNLKQSDKVRRVIHFIETYIKNRITFKGGTAVTTLNF